MNISPTDVSANLIAAVAADAISAAVVHSQQLAKKILRRNETRARLRKIEAIVGQFPSGVEDQVRNYLDSQPGRKLITSLAYLAVLDDIGGDRVHSLGELFVKEVKRGCPHANEEAIQDLWLSWTEAFRLTLAQLGTQGFLSASDMRAAKTLYSETRKDNKTGKAIPILPGSFLRRVEINESQQRIELLYAAIDIIRARVAQSRKYMELPHLRERHRVSLEDLYIQRGLIRARTYSFDLLSTESLSSDEKRDYYSEVLPPRLVILGSPGVGKSTYVSQLLYQCATDQSSSRGRTAPIILNLRDYAGRQDKQSFAQVIAQSIEATYQCPMQKDVIEDIFAMGSALVVFDGLDEVLDLTQRRAVTQRIELFCKQYPSCDVVVTSREVGYWSANLDPSLFMAVTLPSFSAEQVEEYVTRWFARTSTEGELPEVLALDFMEESVQAQDLLSNPLMLSLLCGVYQYAGYIPENRPSLYEECSRLLFYRWDRLRHIPAYSWKEAKMLALVQELAAFFFRTQSAQRGVSERQIWSLIRNYLRDNVVADVDEAGDQARDFLEYCSGRAWVISKVGTDRGEALYGFTHRTFMEYFAAKALARESPTPIDLADRVSKIITNSQGSIVPQLAVQFYEEQVSAGGADECLRYLLFGSKVTKRVDERYLWFTLKALQFVPIKPTTASQVLHASVEAWTNNRRDNRFVPEMLLQVSGDTASNFRGAILKICADVRSGKIEARRLLPLDGLAKNLLPKMLEDDAWVPVLGEILQISDDSRVLMASEDPLLACSLVEQRVISFEKWAELHGVSGLLTFGTGGRTYPGVSVRLITRQLIEDRRRSPIAKFLLSHFGDIRPWSPDMFSSWLEMINHGLENSLSSRSPSISANDDGALIYLACLASMEEDDGRIPSSVRDLLTNWAGIDIVEVAADARGSDYESILRETFDYISTILRSLSIEGEPINLVRDWIIDGGSLIGRQG